jgi:hypothetical protein
MSDSDLRAALTEGASRQEIAAKYGVNVSNVGRAIKKIQNGTNRTDGTDTAGQGTPESMATPNNTPNYTQLTPNSTPNDTQRPSSAPLKPRKRSHKPVGGQTLPLPPPRSSDGQPSTLAADELSMWTTHLSGDDNFALINDLLDRKKYPLTDTKTRIRLIAERRKHIDLGVRTMEALYRIQETRAYQEDVRASLDDLEPSAREQFLDTMRVRSARRRAAGWS